MWVKYQPNPCGRNVGDCAVRAISKALGMDWETAYAVFMKRSAVNFVNTARTISAWRTLR